MSRYDKVRFIGYAIPTTPSDIVSVGDPNGSGNVAGTYRAALDFGTDVRARADILKIAVDTARAGLSSGDGVLNVFLAPEFYWHGPMGPYVHAPGEPDPADVILDELQKRFPADEYADFLLVLGTAISAEIADLDAVMSQSSTVVRNDVVRALGESWKAADGPLALVIFDALVNFIKNCHAYAQVEVRNRAFILGPAELDGIGAGLGVRAITTEKYFDSNEDLLLWDVTDKPVITEQMSAYPILDTSGGDFKSAPRDPYAIFRVAGPDPVTVGVEICLDHSDHRMRKGVDRSPWPNRDDGLDLHLIPSCGMQLHPPSVAARAGGWAFNCDGQYALGEPDQAGTSRRDTVGGVPCAYADYVAAADPAYGAHTQLARVMTAPRGSNLSAAGAHDAAFGSAPAAGVTVIPVAPGPDFDGFFAGGPGAVHIYGSDEPLPIRS